MMSAHPKPIAAAVLAIATGLPVVVAAEKDAVPANTQAPGAIQKMLDGIRGTQRLPVAGVQMIDAGGRVLFVSDNGRYVFTGPAWDLWHGARLETLAEGARLAERIDLARLKLDPAALGALDLGTGDEDVVVFIDPLCPHCRSLIGALPSLAERYRFRLVPLPVLGPDSESAVIRMACLTERDPDAAREALRTDRIAKLPEATATCGQTQAQRALVTARLLGIRGVPYLIAPDGRLRQGAPDDLAGWLEGNE
jgi:thiol:disulfide interchange protein DsbC